MFLEAAAPTGGGADKGAGLAADKGFFDFNVARFFQSLQMRAEIAVG